MKVNILEAFSNFLIVVGLGIMGTGILGNIALKLEYINISKDIIMLVPIGFFIIFIGGIMSLASSKKSDAVHAVSEGGEKDE